MNDFTIVGAGLTGATLARLLSDQGAKVRVIERRHEPGGNCVDYKHPSGIMVHRHGPHYFRTNDERIWSFVNRFAEFHNFAAVVQILRRSELVPWPLHRKLLDAYPDQRLFQDEPRNFEQAILAQIPKGAYDDFVFGYTKKQWGQHPRSLWLSLAGRIDIRENNDPRLKLHRYQGVPVDGYTHLIKRMLSGIEVSLGEVGLVTQLKGRVIWTGGIDELFNYDMGKLRYRTQKRRDLWVPHFYGCKHPVVQVNSPSFSSRFVRVIEWKYMLPEEIRFNIPGTLLTYEYPADAESEDEREYPFPDMQNRVLYKRYYERAALEFPHVTFAGRLGEFRYLDMDQAIGRAMMLASRITKNQPMEAVNAHSG